MSPTIYLPHWYSGQHSPSFWMALQPGLVGQDTSLLGIVWPSITQISEDKRLIRCGMRFYWISHSPLLGLVSFLDLPLLALITGDDSSPFVIIRLFRSYTGPGIGIWNGKGSWLLKQLHATQVGLIKQLDTTYFLIIFILFPVSSQPARRRNGQCHGMSRIYMPHEVNVN